MRYSYGKHYALHEFWKFVSNGLYDCTKFNMLYKITYARLDFILNCITKTNSDISGLCVLDVGCAVGLVSIPLLTYGISVTSIDIDVNSINIAKQYADIMNLNSNFINIDILDLPYHNKYDVILCLDVIEHVLDIYRVIRKLVTLLNPNGMIIISTINRTIKAFLYIICAAEYWLKLIPYNTHNYNKFIKPSEICAMFYEDKICVYDLCGIKYNIANKEWMLSDDINVNYIMSISCCS